MKKLVLTIGAFMLVAGAANAQFRLEAKPDQGYFYDIDTAKATVTQKVNFNAKVDGVTEAGSSLKRISTNRGIRVQVLNELNQETHPSGNDSRINNINSNGQMLSLNDTQGIIGYYTKADTVAWSDAHKFYMPANGIFKMNEEGDYAFGSYPGMYKIVDNRFAFTLDGLKAASDIELDIFTLDPGNTGKTKAITMYVKIGSDMKYPHDGIADYTVDSIYVSGDERKHIKLGELLGLDPAVAFTSKKVYLSFYTKGTGATMNPFQYDPIIGFDNFTVTMGLPYWNVPAAGPIANYGKAVDNVAVEGNVDAPLYPIEIKGDTAIYALDLEMGGRLKDLAITLDEGTGTGFPLPALLNVNVYGAQIKEGDVWKNAGTVTVPADGIKQKVTVAKGDGSLENIRLLLYRINKEADVEGEVVNNTFELDNGTRIWYEIYIAKSKTAVALDNVAASEVSAYANNKAIFVNNAIESVAVYNAAGQIVKTVSADAAAQGIAVEAGIYIVSTADYSQKVVVK